MEVQRGHGHFILFLSLHVSNQPIAFGPTTIIGEIGTKGHNNFKWTEHQCSQSCSCVFKIVARGDDSLPKKSFNGYTSRILWTKPCFMSYTVVVWGFNPCVCPGCLTQGLNPQTTTVESCVQYWICHGIAYLTIKMCSHQTTSIW